MFRASKAIFASLAGLLMGVGAFAQPVDAGHARVEMLSEQSTVIPGETVWFGLSFEMDRNWHIYWKNAGDAGIPPSLAWAPGGDIGAENAGPFEWPVPELLPIVEGEIMDYGYSGAVVLPFPVTIPEDASGTLRAEGRTDYLICENICIPESAPYAVELEVGSAPVPDMVASQRITTALAEVPPVFEGEASLAQSGERWILSVAGEAAQGDITYARFFPDGHDIVHAADQPFQAGAQGLQLELTPSRASGDLPEALTGLVKTNLGAVRISASPGSVLQGTSGSGTAQAAKASLAFLVLFALIGGLILNLMPCVLPVLSIKALGLVHSAASGDAAKVRAHGLWYTAGVLGCFGLLAALVVAVRSATGIVTWGFWLQDPVIVTGLILLLFLLGLWLLGVLQIGGSVQNIGSGLAARQGSLGAFFTGFLAAVVGAPCTGPFLGAALGAVLTQSAASIFVVLIAMGLGMALPILLLSFVPGLHTRLPKPGAWMETLKQVFAFPMFLTAAWLLSVLGALAGYRTAAIVVAGATLIGFGLWAFKAVQQGPRAVLVPVLGLASIVPVFALVSATALGDILVALGFLAALVLGAVILIRMQDPRLRLVGRLFAGAAVATGLIWPIAETFGPRPATTSGAAYSATYPTEAWSPETVEAMVSEGRPVFVDFTAEWCATCQANKLQTLQTRAVANAFESANVAFLVADYTRPDPVIAAELKRRDRAGVPMYLWYPAGEREPVVLPEVLSVRLLTDLVEGER